MPALLFNKCCGCIELRTGCLIIGYLQLVGEIIAMLLVLLMLLGGSVVAATAEEGEKGEEAKGVGAAVVALSAVLLLVLALFLAFTITLLVGLHKSKRGHVKAYLVYAAIFSVVCIIVFFASFAGPVSAGDIVKNLISIVLNIYFLLVVRSYYYKMDDKLPAVYNTA